MGMYTELNISMELKQDLPSEVINLLNYMTGNMDELIDDEIPNHPLFVDTRWRFMLRGNSYYFDMIPQYDFGYDNISNSYYLSVRSNFKNYENEIDKFLDWIKPYTETQGFIGYSRYEEHQEPSLIYFD